MPVSPGLAGTPFADNPASPWGNAPPAIASWLTANWGTPGFDTATVGTPATPLPGTPQDQWAAAAAQYGGAIPMGGGAPAGWAPGMRTEDWGNPLHLLSGRTPIGAGAPLNTPPPPPPAAAPPAPVVPPGAAPPGLGGLFGNMNNSAPPGSLIASLMALLRQGGFGQGRKTGMPMGVRGMMQGMGGMGGRFGNRS